MNKGMLAIGVIILSLIALLLINVLTNFSTGSELDYYLVRETVDSAMGTSVDKMFSRDCGVPRIDRDRFAEEFLVEFVKNVDNSREYDIYLYDINEVPPKVSVKVNSSTVLGFNVKENGGQKADISTSYDAIVASDKSYSINIEDRLNDPNSDACKMYYNLDK